MQVIREAMDQELPISLRARRTFAVVYFSVGLILAYLAWQNAADKTVRLAASDTKTQAMKAVDSTTDFGRVILDGNGKIVSWNRGMTTLTGRTSKEMIGKPLSAILAGMSPAAAETINQLLDGTGGLAYANVELPRKNVPGSTTLVRMHVRKVSGQPGTFRFVAVDPVGQINAVTP